LARAAADACTAAGAAVGLTCKRSELSHHGVAVTTYPVSGDENAASAQVRVTNMRGCRLRKRRGGGTGERVARADPPLAERKREEDK